MKELVSLIADIVIIIAGCYFFYMAIVCWLDGK